MIYIKYGKKVINLSDKHNNTSHLVKMILHWVIDKGQSYHHMDQTYVD